ncbi:MAG: hypothetical protein R6X06_08330 [Gammaproteobacteria bacterium]
MKVELVYEQTCPNIAAAREQLRRAFSAAGLEPRWQEWDVARADAPAYTRGYGSPTILVNGVDITGEAATRDDLCCRVYADTDSPNLGVPPLAQIAAALRQGATTPELIPETIQEPIPAPPGTPPPARRLFALNLSLLPGVGTALLPKLTCPACWPAYAGLWSSLGLGFFDYTPYLLPAMLAFIGIALFALGFRARQRRGYGPLLLGSLAAAPLLASTFFTDSDVLMWTALTVLVGASLWNTWPRAAQPSGTCSACSPALHAHDATAKSATYPGT